MLLFFFNLLNELGKRLNARLGARMLGPILSHGIKLIKIAFLA